MIPDEVPTGVFRLPPGSSLRRVRHDWQKIAMLMFAELRAAEAVMAATGGDCTAFVTDAVHEALDIFRSRTTISAVMVDPDFHFHA